MQVGQLPERERARVTDARVSHGQLLSVAVRTDTGKVRPNNEDSSGLHWAPDNALLAIVCDGMGGHEAGEVASRLAVDTITAEVLSSTSADPRHRLYNAFLRANEVIVAEGQRSQRRGMGTTGVVALVRGNEVFVGLVGDSRLLHVRRGHLQWRTLDHTRVQSLVERGLLREEDARSHSDAGMLTRALGHVRMSNGDPLEPEVQREPVRLEEGDALVLCTDGCHDLLEDWEIARAVAGCSPEEACERLITMSLDRGGHDNVTVAVVVAGDRARPFDPSAARKDPQGPNHPGFSPPGGDLPRPEPVGARGAAALSPGVPGPPHAGAGQLRPGAPRGGMHAARTAVEEPPDTDPGARSTRRSTRLPDTEPSPDQAEAPAWFWLAAIAGAALLTLSLVMLATAVWLAV